MARANGGVLEKMVMISKKDKEIIKNKFGGKCAYTGRDLDDDWQIDHLKSIRLFKIGKEKGDPNHIENLYPALKIVNHYKRALPLEAFRNWFLGELHVRLKKLPRNPKTEKGIKRKIYLLSVAEVFGISEDNPFTGIFYFETLKN